VSSRDPCRSPWRWPAAAPLLIAIDRPGRDAGGTEELEEVTWSQALAVGLVQVAALWPGMSRSGATVIGGLLAGLSRRVALEFSFFPRHSDARRGVGLRSSGRRARSLVASDAPIFALGFVVSFAVSLVVIAVLLRYVRDHDLRPFGWYRIALAAIVILALAL